MRGTFAACSQSGTAAPESLSRLNNTAKQVQPMKSAMFVATIATGAARVLSGRKRNKHLIYNKFFAVLSLLVLAAACDTPPPVPSEPAPLSFAGSEACRECHARIAKPTRIFGDRPATRPGVRDVICMVLPRLLPAQCLAGDRKHE